MSPINLNDAMNDGVPLTEKLRTRFARAVASAPVFEPGTAEEGAFYIDAMLALLDDLIAALAPGDQCFAERRAELQVLAEQLRASGVTADQLLAMARMASAEDRSSQEIPDIQEKPHYPEEEDVAPLAQ